jgi:hypothetical protein
MPTLHRWWLVASDAGGSLPAMLVGQADESPFFRASARLSYQLLSQSHGLPFDVGSGGDRRI